VQHTILKKIKNDQEIIVLKIDGPVMKDGDVKSGPAD